MLARGVILTTLAFIVLPFQGMTACTISCLPSAIKTRIPPNSKNSCRFLKEGDGMSPSLLTVRTGNYSPSSLPSAMKTTLPWASSVATRPTGCEHPSALAAPSLRHRSLMRAWRRSALTPHPHSPPRLAGWWCRPAGCRPARRTSPRRRCARCGLARWCLPGWPWARRRAAAR